MGAKRRFRWAVAGSLLAHAGLWWWVSPLPDADRPPVQLEIVLTPAAPEPAPGEVVPSEPVAPESALPEPVSPEPIASDPLAWPVEAQEQRPDEALLADEPTTLNLEKPENWDELVRSIPAPGPTALAFNPGLSTAVQSRRKARQRRALVAQRASATYGVSDEQYARSGPLGDETKLDGRCVILAEDKGVEEGARWWASQCTDTQQNPFSLPTIEYDAVGRVIAN